MSKSELSRNLKRASYGRPRVRLTHPVYQQHSILSSPIYCVFQVDFVTSLFVDATLLQGLPNITHPRNIVTLPRNICIGGEGGGGLRRAAEICVFNAPPSQHKNFKNTPSYGMIVAHPCNIISKLYQMYDFA